MRNSDLRSAVSLTARAFSYFLIAVEKLGVSVKLAFCFFIALFSVAATKKDKKIASMSLAEVQIQRAQVDPKAQSFSAAQVYGQIRMEGMQYLTELPESPQLTYSQLISARLTGFKETTWMDFAFDVSGGTFLTRGQSHLVVHELYSSTQGSNATKGFVGRKKKDWSELDRRWQMGLWQPKFAIDALRPEEQGLTGFFVDHVKPNFEFVAFGTPIFIPSMGPDIREERGGLVSDSRWYRAPSRDYDFNNRINKIQYALNIPETAKLVGNGGIALMGRVGDKENGPWFSAGSGYIPVNELLLKRKNFKDISTDKVDVTVSPDVIYHSLLSLDFGYSQSSFKATVSYLIDDPVEKKAEVDWSVQTLEPLRAYGASLDFSLSNFLNKTLAVQLDYLRVEGGGIVDKLSDGGPDDFTLFDQRTHFTNAFSVRLEGQLATFFKRPFVTRFKYLYELEQKGSLLNSEFLYYPNQKWAVVLGGDVLGVRDATSKSSRFINEYRANDRVYGGMTYVF